MNGRVTVFDISSRMTSSNCSRIRSKSSKALSVVASLFSQRKFEPVFEGKFYEIGARIVKINQIHRAYGRQFFDSSMGMPHPLKLRFKLHCGFRAYPQIQIGTLPSQRIRASHRTKYKQFQSHFG